MGVLLIVGGWRWQGKWLGGAARQRRGGFDLPGRARFDLCGVAPGGDAGGVAVHEHRRREHFWIVDGIEAAGVGDCELKPIEQAARVTKIHLVGRERLDDLGDRDLNGSAIFEDAGVEDGSLTLRVGTADGDGAIEPGRVVQAAMEVTEDGVSESDGMALQAVGPDVMAERYLHGGPLSLSDYFSVICR